MTPTTSSPNLLEDKLRELAMFEPVPLPVLSLYVNTQPDKNGRPNFEPFLRKELKAKAATFASRSPELESFDRDTEKITAWFETELRPSTNGVAIFACAGADDFFEAVQLDVPIDTNQLFVYHQPHLYTLARLNDQYPAYAAVIADTNSARIFVFGLGAKLDADTVTSAKLGRTQVGGWSQARYQRRVDNLHAQHAKEVVEALEKVVREEGIQHVIFSGDEVMLPALHEQLTPFLADKLVEELRLHVTAPEHEILKATLASMRDHDSRTDEEESKAVIGAYRANGLAAAGVRDVLKALTNGQVDTLFLSTTFDDKHPDLEEIAKVAPDTPVEGPPAEEGVHLSDELVTRAKQTGARVKFIEDDALLARIGGVGATLRYRI